MTRTRTKVKLKVLLECFVRSSSTLYESLFTYANPNWRERWETKMTDNDTNIHDSFEKQKNDFILKAQGVLHNSCFDASNNSELYADLKKYWDEAIFVIKDKNLCDQWFDRIFHQHNETGRFYHTAVHLQEILKYWSIVASNKSQHTSSSIQKEDRERRSKAIQLATFFHDAIYDPKSSENEKDSAKLFQEFCSQVLGLDSSSSTTTSNDTNLSSSIAQLTTTLILATERHQVLAEASMDAYDVDTQKLFLDLDMAVLGKENEAYLAYAGLIRKEYAFVDRNVYCQKRAEILTGFLQNKKRIFLSDLLHHVMEDRARKNLQKEIDLLRSGIIPGEPS